MSTCTCSESVLFSFSRNVKLGEDKAREQLAEMNLSVLVSLRSLSVSHCSLTSLDSLTGRVACLKPRP